VPLYYDTGLRGADAGPDANALDAGNPGLTVIDAGITVPPDADNPGDHT
jgi:hypothetical protein